MRKPRFDIKIFKQHREALAAHFHDGALILVAHPEYIRNNDVHHNYRQDSNFFYLTGFEEPESIFVFRPGKVPETVLFVRPKDVERETWDGFRFGPDTAQREFGMDKAYTMSEFAAQAPELLSDVSRVFYRLYAFSEYDQLIESALLATKDKLRRSGRGLLTIEDPTSIIGEHRMFKSAQELAEMRMAANASRAAHIEVMKSIRPGINERTLYGVFLKSIMQEGADREAYRGIFASGNNATTLHYVFNDQVCRTGELFLIDAGAEYNFYASDVTRTYPVNGKFSEDQKRVYNHLLTLQKDLIAMVKPGLSFQTLQKETISRLVDLMLAEGLLSGSKDKLIADGAYLKFYPHGVGHWLGMDVHDAGLAHVNGEPRQFKEGMCFTIEPGIYVPENTSGAPAHMRGMGIRIEDNVVVTSEGCEVLTAAIPKEVHELEAIIGTGV